MTYEFNLDNELNIKPISKVKIILENGQLIICFMQILIKKEWSCMERERGYRNEKRTCALSASDCQSRLVIYKDTVVGGRV